MTETGKPLPASRPETATRKTLLQALLYGALPGIFVAVALQVTGHRANGGAVLAGTAIVALPQLWFVIRATRSAVLSGATTLAMAKFSLSAAGFALWFAWRPDASLAATLAGSILTLIATTAALVTVQRPSTTH